jgi:hypothetical protein
MIVREAVTRPVRCRHRDQHHDLPGALVAEPAGEREDRPGRGGVFGVQYCK